MLRKEMPTKMLATRCPVQVMIARRSHVTSPGMTIRRRHHRCRRPDSIPQRIWQQRLEQLRRVKRSHPKSQFDEYAAMYQGRKLGYSLQKWMNLCASGLSPKLSWDGYMRRILWMQQGRVGCLVRRLRNLKSPDMRGCLCKSPCPQSIPTSWMLK